MITQSHTAAGGDGHQDDGPCPSTLSAWTKLRWSMPWLLRYPLWRAKQWAGGALHDAGTRHVVLMVANHFEPGWDAHRQVVDFDTQQRRLADWCAQARATGQAVRDHDGTPFRHTYFYPAEAYHRELLRELAALQADGLGEVEVHLHHGVDQPDNAANLRRVLLGFRDALVEEHHCLSRRHADGPAMYGFVHGNWALGNSAGGRCCGVDSELQVLAETGCYADFTLPAVFERAQVPRFNAIYECGNPLDQRAPHRTGPDVRVGGSFRLPIIFTGPLVVDWGRRKRGLPVPRIEDGVLAGNYPLTRGRFQRWSDARIGIAGRPDWVFVKLYCHGFILQDQDAAIGESLRVFLLEVLAAADRGQNVRIHFATAREFFNIALAACQGEKGDPAQYRDYSLRPIMGTP